MRRTVKKFSSFSEADEADDRFYAEISFEERLKILAQLIGHTNEADGAVKRHIRIYPLAESEEC